MHNVISTNKCMPHLVRCGIHVADYFAVDTLAPSVCCANSSTLPLGKYFSVCDGKVRFAYGECYFSAVGGKVLFCLTAKLRLTLFENKYCRKIFSFGNYIFYCISCSNKQRHNYSRQRIISLTRLRVNITIRDSEYYHFAVGKNCQTEKSHFFAAGEK